MLKISLQTRKKYSLFYRRKYSGFTVNVIFFPDKYMTIEKKINAIRTLYKE